MDSLSVAMIMSRNLQNHEANSALPNAPVVPDRPRRPRTAPVVRSRRAVAAALERAAKAVAPARPATSSCIPAP